MWVQIKLAASMTLLRSVSVKKENAFDKIDRSCTFWHIFAVLSSPNFTIAVLPKSEQACTSEELFLISVPPEEVPQAFT